MKFKLVTLLTIISIIIGYAFKKISWIIDSKLAESIINKDDSFKLTPDNVSQFLFLSAIGYLMGIIIAFIISIIIAKKLNFGLLNVIIALILSYVIERYLFQSLIISPGQFISNSIFWIAIIDLILLNILALAGYLYIFKKETTLKSGLN